MVDNNGLGEVMSQNLAFNANLRQLDTGELERQQTKRNENREEPAKATEVDNAQRSEQLQNESSEASSERVELERNEVSRVDELSPQEAEDTFRLEQDRGNLDITA